jgi:hypothetical protein
MSFVDGKGSNMLTFPATLIPKMEASSLVSAIVKVSWRVVLGVSGLSVTAEGGIAGSCFALENGMVISCLHGLDDGLFVPNPGYSRSCLFVVEPNGSYSILSQDMVHAFPEFDLSVLEGVDLSVKYPVSDKSPEEVLLVSALGYEADQAPFQTNLSDDYSEVFLTSIKLDQAAQKVERVAPKTKVCTINAMDLSISEKFVFVLETHGTVGLSGGPLIDSETNEVVGLNIAGLPADAHVKTSLISIDIRQREISHALLAHSAR